MCDASFIPLEQLKGLLERQRELTQEDYIALREEIENDREINQTFGGARPILPGGMRPRGKKDNSTFEKNLVAYATQQMKYTDPEVINRLSRLAETFLAKLPAPPQKTAEDILRGRLMAIERHLVGYYATWILDIGLKAGLFAAIAEAEPISVEDLSWQLELTPLYVEVWCKAAYGLELLDVVLQRRSPKRYTLAPGMKELLLDPTNPISMRFDIAFSTILHQDFLAFPRYLRTGATWPLADRPAELHKLYVEATRDDYPVITDVILPAMEQDVEQLKAKGITILDVGTGAGFALVHYAKTFPHAKVVGLDIDPSRVTEAQHTVQAAVTNPDLSNHEIVVRCQDINTLDDPGTYDIIVINLVLYQIRFSEYTNVFDRIFKALKQGGIVVIAEYNFSPLAPERTYRFPGYQAFLSHLLHFALIGATLAPAEKLVELLKARGFEVVRDAAIHHPLEERQVIVARKP